MVWLSMLNHGWYFPLGLQLPPEKMVGVGARGVQPPSEVTWLEP